MKYRIIIFFIVSAASVFGQADDTLKWSIGIQYYNPIYLTGTDRFFNDDWILVGGGTSTALYERKYYKNAFGLSGRYNLNEHVAIKLGGGISKRHVTEIASDEVINPFGGEIEKYYGYFEYKQISWNTILGLNFSEKFKKMEVNGGVELAFLHTGKGKQLYHNYYMEYEDPALPDSSDSYSETVIAPGNSYGFGIYLGMEYHFAKHFSAGIEFHEFAFYSVFKADSPTEYRTYERNYLTPTISSQGTVIEHVNFRQFSYSAIAPMIGINYKF